mmetsp:Transcript_17455/g.40127  ORF Transcript_17455/g.40127 Transcript_17455/m.40127 type:complete len:203 (+) Transcript_17455:1618-2226(+)
MSKETQVAYPSGDSASGRVGHLCAGRSKGPIGEGAGLPLGLPLGLARRAAVGSPGLPRGEPGGGSSAAKRTGGVGFCWLDAVSVGGPGPRGGDSFGSNSWKACSKRAQPAARWRRDQPRLGGEGFSLEGPQGLQESKEKGGGDPSPARESGFASGDFRDGDSGVGSDRTLWKRGGVSPPPPLPGEVVEGSAAPLKALSWGDP